MSPFDAFRAAIPKLFDAFELPAITITSTSGGRTKADMIAGRKGTSTTTTRTGRGVLKSRTIRLADGTMMDENVILTDTAVSIGDKIKIGTAEPFEVASVKEVNPQGTVAMLFEATVK